MFLILMYMNSGGAWWNPSSSLSSIRLNNQSKIVTHYPPEVHSIISHAGSSSFCCRPTESTRCSWSRPSFQGLARWASRACDSVLLWNCCIRWDFCRDVWTSQKCWQVNCHFVLLLRGPRYQRVAPPPVFVAWLSKWVFWIISFLISSTGVWGIWRSTPLWF